MADLGWDEPGEGQGPGPTEEAWKEALTEWASTPFTSEQYEPYAGMTGFGQLAGLSPWASTKLQTTEQAGWPGFATRGGGFFPPPEPTPLNPLEAEAPSFLKMLYPNAQKQTLGDYIAYAQSGLADWTKGGVNSPRILTTKEWNDMMPSEREGLLGFLEYIGIDTDDYEWMMSRQQAAAAEAFGFAAPRTAETPVTPFRFAPARQR